MTVCVSVYRQHRGVGAWRSGHAGHPTEYLLLRAHVRALQDGEELREGAGGEKLHSQSCSGLALATARI